MTDKLRRKRQRTNKLRSELILEQTQSDDKGLCIVLPIECYSG